MKYAVMALNLIRFSLERKEEIFGMLDDRRYIRLMDGHDDDDISLWKKGFEGENDEGIRAIVENDFCQSLGNDFAHMMLVISERDTIHFIANEQIYFLSGGSRKK